ncbi:MAG: O-antigen ligase family protein [PVC group bacterium]
MISTDTGKRQEQGTSRPRSRITTRSPEPIRLVLLLGVAFFISWGPGLQKVTTSLNLSRIFPVFALALVIYWLILGRQRFRAFPLPYNLFLIFVLIHTVVGYLFLFPGDFTFGYTGVMYNQAEYYLYAPSHGIMVVRFFLFSLLAYAVSSLLKNRWELCLFSLAYGLGFVFSIFLGGHETVDAIQGFARATGGFLSPNALGITGLVCCFLNLSVFLGRGVGWRGKAAGLFFVLAGIYGMLASVSRNTLFAFACGGLVITYYLPLLKKLRWAVGLCCLLLAAIGLLPGSIIQTMPGRLSVENIQESNWSMRRDIWSDYLREGKRYFFLGLGLDRSIEAVRETYTSDSEGPVIPHQTYLQLLVEFGIVGLLLFLAALWAFIGRGISLASPRAPGMENAVMLGLLAALAVYGVTGSILGERTVFLALGIIAFTQTYLAENHKSQVTNNKQIPMTFAHE